ncbi:MAG: ChaN family lipoprotein [Myxococcota bacterium]
MSALRLAALAAGLGALALSACASASGGGAPPMPDDPSRLAFEVSLTGPASARAWDGRTGAPLDFDALVARLGAVDVVLVGEEHGTPDFQATQLQVAQVARVADYRSIGVEWLPWSLRPTLAAFRGPSSPDVLRALYAAVDWPHTWGYAFSSYAPIFAWALDASMPVEPLNARPEIAHAVATDTVSSLPEALRAEVPPLDSGSDAHRAWFRARMAAAAHGSPHGHGHGPLDDAGLERFYRAQLVWDETMAGHVVALAGSGKVVVFAGIGHTERALGIPARLGSLRYLVVRPVADEDEARVRVKDADFPEREADILWAYPRRTNTASR